MASQTLQRGSSASRTATAPAGRELKVLLCSGIFVQHDAVSDSLGRKLEILRALRRRGAPIEVRLFAQGSEYSAPDISSAPCVADLLRTDYFWQADVYIFEFAMPYELFDSLFVIPDGRAVAVVEHNTTPPDLVDDAATKLACEAATIQRHNMALATRVVCDSEFNLQTALELGIKEERLSVLHLPPTHHPRRAANMSPTGNFPSARPAPRSARFLYLGRLIGAKGVLDLLRAACDLWERGDDDFEVTLAGNLVFSDQSVIAQVRSAVARYGSERLRIVTSPPDAEVEALYEEADALVVPSYHEGYCVPVVEALAARCYVITSDAGNLPNVSGGLGTVVPTGDVDALSGAISEFARRVTDSSGSGLPLVLPTARGELDVDAWSSEVERHLRDYSEAAYERRFIDILLDLAGGTDIGASSRLREVTAARLAELAETSSGRL